jgi:hypothetical protein
MATTLTNAEMEALVVQVQQFLDRRLISTQTNFEIASIACRDFWKEMSAPIPEGIVYSLDGTTIDLTPDGGVKTGGIATDPPAVVPSPGLSKMASPKIVRREDGKELVPGVLEFETQWEFILLDTYISRMDNEGGENRASELNQFQNAMCFAPNIFLTMPTFAASFRGFINHPGKYLAPDYRPADAGTDIFGRDWEYSQHVLILKVLNYAH